MKPGERILLALSRDPGEDDYHEATDPWTLDNALEPLRRELPDLRALVAGRRVLDFGCGAGWQAAALAREGAALVVGVDSNEATLRSARALAVRAGLGTDRLRFAPRVPPELRGGFDVVISQNAMEHFDDPAAILGEMRAALRPGGCIVVTFGPPWLAPSGSHMHFFTRVPWVNLLFSERTVMAVRARYRRDGARRYEEVESGLNRMTVGRFEALVRRCGLRMQRRRYRCVKGIDALQHLPGLRELFINQVTCLLVDPGVAAAAVPRKPVVARIVPARG